MTVALRCFLPLLGLLVAGPAHAQAALKDKAQLVSALSARPPCCVIDGRAASSRQREPLAEALLWRSGLRINPTATVVVIADRDQDALVIGNTLSARHPGKPVFAVKGGLVTWKAALFSVRVAESSGPVFGGPVSFVIPANTCEQGKPLQVLRPDKK